MHMEKKEEKWSKSRASERMVDRLARIVCWSIEINVQCNTNKQIKSGINEFCEMANMPRVGLEYLMQVEDGETENGPHPGAQGRVQTLPCSLGRQSARSPSLERGKPRLSALKRRVRLSCFTCLRCAGSLVFSPLQGEGEIVRFLPAQQSGGDFAFFLVYKGGEICAFHEKIVRVGEISRFRRFSGGEVFGCGGGLPFGQPDRPRAAPRPPAPGTPKASSPPSPRAGLTILAEMTLGGSI
ncbi:hypothetical protein T01_4868 [Trichinella spiralis]|uniref:Uncharacterized protein n=1 Tax=Trichinella spiralis TaxID=6334 RepID=A0A0V1B3L6_TRISP|nr:hypothetical protein T01_4868 [Trichinella spiralis]